MSLPITPRTKIGELLKAYPQLEEALVGYAPQFAKLRNPILRRTVARVATLQAAAVTAGVDVGRLVAALRALVGQDTSGDPIDGSERPADAAGRSEGSAPAWTTVNEVVETIDADALLQEGAHPLGKIKQLVRDVRPGMMVRLESSFRPEPLIESLASDGFQVHGSRGHDDKWVTLIAGKCD